MKSGEIFWRNGRRAAACDFKDDASRRQDIAKDIENEIAHRVSVAWRIAGGRRSSFLAAFR